MANSPLITWTEEYAIGHKSLDEEHRRLVNAINRLHAAEEAGRTKQELKSLLKTIELATLEHFRHENAVLTLELSGKLDNETCNEHLAEHARALAELESIIHRLGSGTTFDGSELSYTLKHWFVAHVTEHDVHLKREFQAKAANRANAGSQIVDPPGCALPGKAING